MDVNIKDFILADVSETEKTMVARKKKETVNVLDKYSTVFASGPDFAIRKKLQRTSSVMVFMMSQNQFYIKNEKTDEIKLLTADNMKSFFAGTSGSYISIADPETKEAPWWIDRISGDGESCERLISTIKNKDFRLLATKNLCWNPIDRHRFSMKEKSHITEDECKTLSNLKRWVTTKNPEIDSKSFNIGVSSVLFGSNTTNEPSSKCDSLINNLLFNKSNAMTENEKFSLYDVLFHLYGIDGIRQIVEEYAASPVQSFFTLQNVLSIFGYRATPSIRWAGQGLRTIVFTHTRIQKRKYLKPSTRIR